MNESRASFSGESSGSDACAGPSAWNTHPRTNVLSLIPDCLENNFEHTFTVWCLVPVDDVIMS